MNLVYYILIFLYFLIEAYSQSVYQLPKITIQANQSIDSMEQRISSKEQNNWEIKNDLTAIDLTTHGTYQRGYPEGLVVQGTKTEYSSFFIEDFQIYDHSNNNGNLSAAYLSSLETSSIEIDTTNATNTLDALGGSIKFSNNVPKHNISRYEAEVGTFDTNTHRLYHHHAGKFTNLQVGFNALKSRGFRDIPLARRTNFMLDRRDPTFNLGGMFKIETHSPTSDWEFGAISHQQHHNQNYKELDLIQNPERINRSLFYLHGLTLKRNSSQSRWNPEFSLGIHGINRQHQSLRQPFIPYDRYQSQTTEFNWNNNYKVNEKNIMNVGTKISNDSYGMINQSYQMGGISTSKMKQQLYLGHKYTPYKPTTIHMKIMTTHRTHTRWFPSLSLGCTSKIQQTKTQFGVFYHLLSHIPSLYQLHDRRYGNKNLKSEKGHKVELKIQQKINPSIQWNVNIYKTNIRDAITFIPVNGNLFIGQYSNAGRLTTHGIENALRIALSQNTIGIVNHTFCISKDRDHLQQIRIPQHKISAGIRHNLTADTTTTIMYTHYGKMSDLQRFKPYNKLYIGGYGIMRATLSHIINDNMKVFTRVENMLKRQYENPLGYMQPGQAFYAGLTITG